MKKWMFIFGLLLVLAACEMPNVNHTHSFATEYSSDDASHWYECSCGEKQSKAAHTGGVATCTAKAICEVCGHEYGALAEHSFTNYVKNDDATCTKNATETAICDNDGCQATDSREVVDSKLDHTFDQKVMNKDTEVKPATCSSFGVYHYSCICGAIGDDTFDGDVYGEHQHEMYAYFDEKTHSIVCACGDEKFEEHYGGMADEYSQAICEGCGQPYGEVMSHEHNYSLMYDEKYHWQYCYECGDSVSYEEHYGGMADEYSQAICEGCGQPYGDIMSHEHDYVWNYDEYSHWQFCTACGTVGASEPHYGETMTDTGQIMCDVCYQLFGDPSVMPGVLSIYNFSIKVNSIDSYGCNLVPTWELSHYLGYYNAYLTIAELNVYSIEVKNGEEVYVSFPEMIANMNITVTAEIVVTGSNDMGIEMGNSSMCEVELSYIQPIIPELTIIDVKCDPYNKQLHLTWDNSPYDMMGTGIEVNVCNYDGEEVYTGYYLNNSGSEYFDLSMYELREENYYLAVRVVDYSTAMPVFTQWRYFAFQYYIEYTQLPTPEKIEYTWDIKSQTIEITWDVTPYTSYERVMFMITLGDINEYAYYVLGEEFYGASFYTKELTTNYYTLTVQAVCNETPYTYDSEVSSISNVYIEETPVMQTLPQIRNIQVEMISCVVENPSSSIIFKISWDDMMTDLPVTGYELGISLIGSYTYYEVENGQIFVTGGSYYTNGEYHGITLYNGTYTARLRALGDNFYSSTSTTEFTFYVHKESEKDLEHIDDLTDFACVHDGSNLNVSWSINEQANIIPNKYYVEIKDAEGNRVYKELVYSTKLAIDTTNFASGEYTIKVFAVGEYTYDGNLASGYLNSNPVTFVFKV